MTTVSAPARTELRRPDGTPVRVLVVDDEATLAELVSMALRYEGWEVRSAADGRNAVRVAREFRPAAVVLDIMLPDFDGLEVLRKLRAEAPNLLANARTHTPPGITVTTNARSNRDSAILTVTDDGPGIPAALLPEVFGRFARGDSSRSRAAGSTGLGLAIVTAVVAAHHGTVEVTSIPGKHHVHRDIAGLMGAFMAQASTQHPAAT